MIVGVNRDRGGWGKQKEVVLVIVFVGAAVVVFRDSCS